MFDQFQGLLNIPFFDCWQNIPMYHAVNWIQLSTWIHVVRTKELQRAFCDRITILNLHARMFTNDRRLILPLRQNMITNISWNDWSDRYYSYKRLQLGSTLLSSFSCSSILNLILYQLCLIIFSINEQQRSTKSLVDTIVLIDTGSWTWLWWRSQIWLRPQQDDFYWMQ